MEIDPVIKETIHVIVGSCYEVYKELHGGLLEKVYEDCLCYELQSRKHLAQQQVDVPVWYKGIKIGKNYKIDVLVDQSIILELKAADELVSENRMQLFNYMRLTKITYGMLINFSKDHGVRFERYFLDTATNNCSIF
jgi:GxxExxY protein